MHQIVNQLLTNCQSIVKNCPPIVSYLAIKLTDSKILKLTKAKISDLWDFVYDPYETEWLLVIIPFHILKQ